MRHVPGRPDLVPHRVREAKARVEPAVERAPGGDLAVAAMGDARLAFRADRRGQMQRQQRDRLGRQGIDEGLGANGIGGLDGVVQRPHAGGGPQPVRRLQRQLGIVDHRLHLQARIDGGVLDPARLVGGAAGGRELPGRKRRRQRDVDHLAAAGSRRGEGCGEVEPAGLDRHVPPVHHRSRGDLGGIDGTAPAKADHRVGVQPLEFGGQVADGLLGHMLSRPGKDPRATPAHGGGHALEQPAPAQRPAGHHHRAAEPAPLQLGPQFGDLAGPEHHLFQTREGELAGRRQHLSSSDQRWSHKTASDRDFDPGGKPCSISC